MRNLAQYPITHAEKVAAVEWAANNWEPGPRVGDVTGAALRAVLEDVRRQGAQVVGSSRDLTALPTDGGNPQLMAAILDANLNGKGSTWDAAGALVLKDAWAVVREHLLRNERNLEHRDAFLVKRGMLGRLPGDAAMNTQSQSDLGKLREAMERIAKTCEAAQRDHDEDCEVGLARGKSVEEWEPPLVECDLSDLRLLRQSAEAREEAERKLERWTKLWAFGTQGHTVYGEESACRYFQAALTAKEEAERRVGEAVEALNEASGSLAGAAMMHGCSACKVDAEKYARKADALSSPVEQEKGR